MYGVGRWAHTFGQFVPNKKRFSSGGFPSAFEQMIFNLSLNICSAFIPESHQHCIIPSCYAPQTRTDVEGQHVQDDPNFTRVSNLPLRLLYVLHQSFHLPPLTLNLIGQRLPTSQVVGDSSNGRLLIKQTLSSGGAEESSQFLPPCLTPLLSRANHLKAQSYELPKDRHQTF